MTPTQTAEIEAAIVEVRAADAVIGPLLDQRKALDEEIDSATVRIDAARSSYETLMWQLMESADVLDPAQAAPAPVEVPVEAAPVEPAPAPEVQPVEAPAPAAEPAPAPVTEGADATVTDPAPVEPTPPAAA